MQTIVVPGPSGSPVPLAAFGIPVANDINDLITDLWTPITTAWTAYTPTWASSGTQPAIVNGTITGRYKRVGKMGWVNAVLTAGGSTTFGTGTYTLSLPATWTAASAVGTTVGGVECFDASATTTYEGSCKVAAGLTTLSFNTHAATAGVGQLVPMTWANLDTLRFYAGGIELT